MSYESLNQQIDDLHDLEEAAYLAGDEQSQALASAKPDVVVPQDYSVEEAAK